MSIVVQKYGGSSVANAERIQKVAQRVANTRAEGKKVCVVVSAMGSTTDELLAKAKAVSNSPSRRELDMLLSCGERASMALLSMAVQDLGHEAISFTGSQCGIMTNDRHWGARIVEVRPFRVEDELERGKVVIVAGFQGVSYKREITTLGRGGSDITAVALAAALGAEYCEICSDVDGVYSADPRKVSAAELLDAISHDTMLELAAHGAKVLHPDSVEFARQKGVALFARATAKDGGGTRIDHVAPPHGVTVTSQKPLVKVTATGLDATRTLLEFAETFPLPLAGVQASAHHAEAWVPLVDVPGEAELEKRAPDDVSIERGYASVTAVGDLIGQNAGRVRRLVEMAAARGVVASCVTASALRVTLYCKETDADRLVGHVYEHVRSDT